jgi:hypothetical protein
MTVSEPKIAKFTDIWASGNATEGLCYPSTQSEVTF